MVRRPFGSKMNEWRSVVLVQVVNFKFQVCGPHRLECRSQPLFRRQRKADQVTVHTGDKKSQRTGMPIRPVYFGAGSGGDDTLVQCCQESVLPVGDSIRHQSGGCRRFNHPFCPAHDQILLGRVRRCRAIPWMPAGKGDGAPQLRRKLLFPDLSERMGHGSQVFNREQPRITGEQGPRPLAEGLLPARRGAGQQLARLDQAFCPLPEQSDSTSMLFGGRMISECVAVLLDLKGQYPGNQEACGQNRHWQPEQKTLPRGLWVVHIHLRGAVGIGRPCSWF